MIRICSIITLLAAAHLTAMDMRPSAPPPATSPNALSELLALQPGLTMFLDMIDAKTEKSIANRSERLGELEAEVKARTIKRIIYQEHRSTERVYTFLLDSLAGYDRHGAADFDHHCGHSHPTWIAYTKGYALVTMHLLSARFRLQHEREEAMRLLVEYLQKRRSHHQTW